MAFFKRVDRIPDYVRWSERDLFDAVHAGNKEHVDKILNTREDWRDVQNEWGRTPFLVACTHGNVQLADSLVARGCNVLAKDKNGDGALALATMYGQLIIVASLVNRLGIDVNETHQNNYTSLHWAARNNRLGVAEFLIEKGANINARNKFGETPFLVASGRRNVNMVYVLLEAGCDIYAKNNRGNGPLAVAIENRLVNMIKLLVNGFGMDVNETHDKGYTSLHLATNLNNVDIVKFLIIDSGANIEAKDQWNRTPFLIAVCHGYNTLVELLASRGCNVKATNSEGAGALDLACIWGHAETVEVLLSKGFFTDGCAALHVAAQNGFDRIVSLLISGGADIEARDEWGCTPFLTAVEFGQDKVTEVLMKGGCNVFARTKKGECALDLTITGGRLDLLKGFIAAGLNLGQLTQETRRFLEQTAVQNKMAAEYLIEILLLQANCLLIDWNLTTLYKKDLVSVLGSIDAAQSAKFEQERDEARRDKEIAIVEMQQAAETMKREHERERAKFAIERDHLTATLSEMTKEKELEKERNDCLEEQVAEHRLAEDKHLKEKNHLTEERDHLKTIVKELRTFAQQRDQTLLGDIESARQNGERLQRECAELAAERDRLTERNRLLRDCKEETEKNLHRAQEYENLLSIPPSDVRITDIKLGSGGYGEVKVGHWRGCTVAVKEFYEALEGECYLKLFQQEMAVISHVRHPNIVSLCGVTTQSGTPLRIITELLEGSISDVYLAALRAKRPLCVREQVDLAVGFTSGIAYLHQLRPNAILHGDIRSTNVLVTILMEAKVCDLGAARFKGASLSGGPLSGEYLAPERTQADSRESQKGNTTMADVYSLGVTVIELMIGKSPARTRRYDQLANVCHPQINRLAMRMIEKDLSLRPSAEYCLAMLQRVQKSDEEYAACPLKRMVRGKLYGDGHLTLVDRPWPHVNRPNI
ncbi:uncharacterized protein [Oscarella lobularis]